MTKQCLQLQFLSVSMTFVIIPFIVNLGYVYFYIFSWDCFLLGLHVSCQSKIYRSTSEYIHSMRLECMGTIYIVGMNYVLSRHLDICIYKAYSSTLYGLSTKFSYKMPCRHWFHAVCAVVSACIIDVWKLALLWSFKSIAGNNNTADTSIMHAYAWKLR